MGKRISPSLPVGPQFSAGPDAAFIPDGYSREQKNVLQQPLRWAKRPPWLYDGLQASANLALLGFALWDDQANAAIRLLCGFSALVTPHIEIKALADETWSSAASRATTIGGIGDSTNHRGVLYYGSYTSVTTPGALFSFNGTAIAPGAAGTAPGSPFPDGIFAFSLCTFLDRIFLAWVRASVLNKLAVAGVTLPYDLTGWTATNVTVKNSGSGTGTVCQLTPTNTSSAKVEKSDVISLGGSDIPQYYQFLSMLQPADPTVHAPLTLEVYVSTLWQAATAYRLGDIVAGATATGKRFKCSQAGTSGGAEPAGFGTAAVGDEVNDNTAKWIYLGSDALASQPVDLPNATEIPDFISYYCLVTVPPFNSLSTINLGLRIKFGNTSSAIVKAPVNVSYKDGLADGDARKANAGQQLTLGRFPLPFCNIEASGLATIELADLMWTETLLTDIRATNTQDVLAAGRPTAVRSIANAKRLFLFKRRSCQVYIGQANPDVPIQEEQAFAVGALHYRGTDVFEDSLFTIAENGVYRLTPGSSPDELCGDAMREEIMNKSTATWVESQAVFYNVPHLKVHHRDRCVYLYTQKGKIFVYDIDGKHSGKPGWSYIDIQNANGPADVSDLIYHPATGKMYAIVAGVNSNQEVRRLDPSVSNSGDTDANAIDYPITTRTVLKPIEQSGQRFDALVNQVWPRIQTNTDQSAQATTVSISFDQGATYPKSNAVEWDNTSGVAKPRPVVVFQFGPSVTIAIDHEGDGGEANYSLTGVTADIDVKRGEFPQVTPTAGSSNL